VAKQIECPRCGERDELQGEQTAEGIVITCGTCGESWNRDAVTQSCATCGGTDLVERPRAHTQYSRGTQLSIVGMSEILLCRTCDARMVEWSEGSARAVPFNYRPSALDPEAAKDRDEDDGGDVLITP
jgi:hypothetical protein